MSRIVDYSSLAQSILDFAHRTDLINYQDYFIQMGEQRIYRDLVGSSMGDGVKWLEMTLLGQIGLGGNTVDSVGTADSTLTVDMTSTGAAGSFPVPVGYISLKDMQVTDGNSDEFTLLYKDPQWIYSNYPIREATGIPRYVARDGANFIFGPYPDSNYSIQGTYYGTSTPLSSTNTSTWMTSICPDVLLAACMIEVMTFLKDQNGNAFWTQIYGQKLEGLIAFDKADRTAPGALTIEVA